MKINEHFFNTAVNKSLVRYEDELIYVFHEAVQFTDKTLKYEGSIETDMKNGELELTIHIDLNKKYSKKAEKGSRNYIQDVEEYLSHNTRYGNTIELFYYKILSTTMIKYCFYNNPIADWEKDVDLLKAEFFSPHKNYLLSIYKKKSELTIGNTANSWNNLILWGIPGIGKSSFIYRLAMMLKLSILSVDLSLYLGKKKELYSIFFEREFSLPSKAEKEQPIQNKIIVLEEFDYALEKILDIEKIFQHKDLLKKEYLTMKNEEIKSRTKKIIDGFESGGDKKPQSLDSATDYKKYLDVEMSMDSYSNDPQFAKLKQKQKFDNELIQINIDLDSILKKTDEDNKSDTLRLSDLLELFQGPVPVSNRIIVATTNNFEKIKDSIPALFRAGRLSPLKFDYLDWTALNELTNYYFGRYLTIPEKKVKIATSFIIELAIKYSIVNSPFEEFQEELQKYLTP
jgi:hypothetical protein